ncbi:Protein kinase protein rad53 [Exophiala xenobiotica]|nr:Protein kinase protein rad53 [Exophiala xenobiotica]
MDDLNIFLTLTPFDEWGLTIDSFRLPHNIGRYVKPSPISRGTTPSECDHVDAPVNELENFHRITLRPQFYISFDSEQRPAIWDNSNNGLTVSYDGEAKDDLRHHFRWIFFPGYETIRVKIPLRNKRELAFHVHLPRHYETNRNDYKKNAKIFKAGSPPPHEVDFNNLALRSPGDSFAPSESLSPSKRPFYLKREELGHGAFGRVKKVLDATTGFEYAGKEVFHSIGWEREIGILKKLRHDNIVGFIDFKRDPEPLLVMEYLPLGNLPHQDSISPIAVEEWAALLHQCLEALVYLHARNITHRDLKPENILVRVGDFGLAKKDVELRTCCGNCRYSAPEAFSNRSYTSAVDIWQLGVIVMEGLYGLPRDTRRKGVTERGKIRQQAFDWCSRIIDAAEDWESDRMIAFLKEYMLKWEPTDRQSAAECLSTAIEIGLFEETLLRTGSLTPRREPAQRPNEIDAEDASTIKEPFGKIVGTEASHEGHTSQSPHSCPSIPEKGSPSTGERHSYRSVKRRRTTHDFDPSLNLPGWSFGLGDASQITPDESLKAFLDSADNSARQAESIQGSIQSNSTDNLPVAPPLKKHGQLVVQILDMHQGTLRVPDTRMNFTTDTSATGPWIELSTARELCATANLSENFRPLLAFVEAQEARRARDSYILSKSRQAKQGEKIPGYTELILEGHTVLIRNMDSWINATQVLRAAGFGKVPFRWQNQKFKYHPVTRLGVFVQPDVAVDLCKLFGLPELGAFLHEKTRVEKVVYTRQRKKDHFHFLECGNDIVAVRQGDLSVSLTHIFKASPAHPVHCPTLRKFKQAFPSIEVVRGNSEVQGSYAHISLAVNLACLLGLTSITEALLGLTSTRDAQVQEVCGDEVLCPNQGPSDTAQPGDVPRDGPKERGSFEWDGPGLNFSEIDKQLQLSRPSFRFMTPSSPSQTSPLRMNHLQGCQRDECDIGVGQPDKPVIYYDSV